MRVLLLVKSRESASHESWVARSRTRLGEDQGVVGEVVAWGNFVAMGLGGPGPGSKVAREERVVAG